MVTQKDVAKKAGVSFITVSRVINNLGNVKEETRVKVEAAIKELRYHPNHLGQALNSGKNCTIGIVSPTRFQLNLEANLYLIGLLDGVEKMCRARGMDILLSTELNSGKGFDFLRPYHQRKVDGMLFIGLQKIAKDQLEEIEVLKIPTVVIGDRPESTAISWIDTDNVAAGRDVAERLLALGHRSFGFVSVDTSKIFNRNILDRQLGFTQALNENGLEPQIFLVSGLDPESGRGAMRQLLRLEKRPTALVCGNDSLALAVLDEAIQSGLKIPRDLSIVGYDALPSGRYYTPSLASYHQPLNEIGYEAAELLIDKIDHPNKEKVSKIFPLNFVDGTSVSSVGAVGTPTGHNQ